MSVQHLALVPTAADARGKLATVCGRFALCAAPLDVFVWFAAKHPMRTCTRCMKYARGLTPEQARERHEADGAS